MILLVIAPSLVCAAAAAALLYALRGRQVDDHPLCRKCGFDLFGKPESSAVCPECGAMLAGPGAVIVGRREPRRLLALAAAPVLVLCGLWLVVAGWATAGGGSLARHKPVWWLMAEARRGSGSARDEALAELGNRLAAGTLSQARAGELIDLALDVQADTARPWSDGYGEVIARAQESAKLPPEKWDRYVRQAAVLKFTTRPTLRRGDQPVLALERPAPRMARRHDFHLSVELLDTRIDDVPVGKGSRGSRWGLGLQANQTWGRTFMRLHVEAPRLAQVPDGPHTLRWAARVLVEGGAAPGRVASKPQTVQFSAPLTLLPDGASGVRLNNDPSLRPAVEKALTVSRLTVSRSAKRTPEASVQVDADRPPIGLAYRVFLRHRGGRESEVGGVHFSPKAVSGYGIHQDVADLADLGGGRLDVILRPSLDRAHDTLDLTEIWGGEVVIRDVPVEAAR